MISAATALRRAIGRRLPWLRPAFGRLHKAYNAGLCRLIASGDRRFMRRTGARYLPPAHLRYRVTNCALPGDFVEGGRRVVESIQAALAGVGRQLGDFERMLDFGCGCGRTLIALADLPDRPALTGTDIDAEAIAWCREHLDFASVTVNGGLPPLPFGEASFDFVLGVSVFTHLDEDYQFRWLDELRRVTRPGGVLLLSVHGENFHVHLSQAEREQLVEHGILFRIDYGRRGILPDFYQVTFHTREYVEREWSRLFRILAYLPRGLADYQDLVVLQKE